MVKIDAEKIYGVLENYEKRKAASDFRRGYKEGAKFIKLDEKIENIPEFRMPINQMRPYDVGRLCGMASNYLKKGQAYNAAALYHRAGVITRDSVIKKLFKRLKQGDLNRKEEETIVAEIRRALEQKK